jgi:putative FmdB family regulatory protein
MYQYKCQKCGYGWDPRVKLSSTIPKACPQCKSYKWRDVLPQLDRLPARTQDVDIMEKGPKIKIEEDFDFGS